MVPVFYAIQKIFPKTFPKTFPQNLSPKPSLKTML